MTSYLSTVVSALDAPKSLLPFFVKDSIDNTGRTLMAASEGGKHEAREKFIEETGTSIFWIGGIPAVRWVANKIAKAKGKIDTDIQFKRINSDGIQNYFADKLTENGTAKFSKEDLQEIVLSGKNLGEVQKKLTDSGFIPNSAKGIYKKYHVGITAASILINLLMLTVAIPKFNQFLSRKIISKEYNDKQKETNIPQKADLNPKAKKISFNGLGALLDFKSLFNFTQMAENAQLNTVSSMLLLDYGISGSRVTFIPRDNNERIEYAVKEGGVILFFYQAADWIKKGFSKLADKAFHTPIDLDYKIITDKTFAQTIKNSVKKDSLFDFVNLAENDDKAEIKIIKFIDQELAKTPECTDKKDIFKNFTLQMAQKNGLVDVEYDKELGKWIRDSKKYIETEKLVELNKNLKAFYEQATSQKGMTIDSIINKTKAAKGLSVLGNIAICSLSLSILLPKIQYLIREHRTKTKTAPGVKHYQDLAKNKQLVV